MSVAAYIPIDRFYALANGQDLPDRTTGAALFADISGFTPLTEMLARELGPRRGCEELTIHLNRVYNALINELHQYRGSTISFSGDAITCWFEGDEVSASHRAVSVALGMQQVMRELAQISTPGGEVLTLALKVAVSSGPVRRFVVGQPDIQRLDLLAGSTLDRLARTEHMANKGEVVVSEEVWRNLETLVQVEEWRDSEETGEIFVVIKGLSRPAVSDPWIYHEELLKPEQLKPWLLQEVYRRIEAGIGDFLTELRPATILFMKFSGLPYDTEDEAGLKLDSYIRWVQGIVDNFEGALLQITIGDKGSYLYACFGAPITRKNDSERAVKAAQILLAPPPELEWANPVQIGINAGTIRAGDYGSTRRHTYGVLGDEVNVAARLMQAAKPGQILVRENVRDATLSQFTWESLPPVRVKGKSEPLVIYQPAARQTRQIASLPEITYKVPMVGRKDELEQAIQKLEIALNNSGQIMALIAEAGMGKSRLAAEIVNSASTRGFLTYVSECQSYGTNTSYFVWENIWRGFFELDQHSNTEEQIKQLKERLEELDPQLVPRLPLLGSPLNLNIPDNLLTASFDAKLRKTSLEALLTDCLQLKAKKAPVLIVLEDCHYLDPLSYDLVEVLGKAIYTSPVMLLLAFRPPELEHEKATRITGLPNATSINLTEFSEEESRSLITLKLKQQVGNQSEPTPEFLERVMQRAQGNPFYIEELLNYLHDRGINPEDTQALEMLELPTSLHSLILSRIDQLSESQKITIKVASIIGRVFVKSWLWGALPNIGKPEKVFSDLEHLSRMELTPLDRSEPELTYLFKHVITREVAYESLPFSTRAQLHQQLAAFLEEKYVDTVNQYIDLLAYHYYLSNNTEKKCEYLRKAGEAAQADFSNQAAIDYYQRLLPLLSEAEQGEIMLRLGQVLELVSDWGRAGELYKNALAIAEQKEDLALKAACLSAIGGLLMRQKRYTEAAPELRQAMQVYHELGDHSGVSQVMTEIGEVYRMQGDYGAAKAHYQESLAVAENVPDRRPQMSARAKALKAAGTASNQQGDPQAAKTLYQESLDILQELNDKPGVASLLNNLGIVARYTGDLEKARELYTASMHQFRELGNRWAEGQLLNNLGLVARYQGDNASARRYLEQSLEIQRKLGDKWGIANALSSLGDIVLDTEDYKAAPPFLKESLVLNVELDNRSGVAYVLEYLSCYAAAENNPELAVRLAAAADALRRQIKTPLSRADEDLLVKRLEPARQTLKESYHNIWEQAQQIPIEEAVELALLNL
jgi:predicted ATPase/class 3 adenylate cyclase